MGFVGSMGYVGSMGFVGFVAVLLPEVLSTYSLAYFLASLN